VRVIYILSEKIDTSDVSVYRVTGFQLSLWLFPVNHLSKEASILLKQRGNDMKVNTHIHLALNSIRTNSIMPYSKKVV